MKIRIELNAQQEETEVVIRCRELSEEIRQLQDMVSSVAAPDQTLVLYKDETEYYLPLSEILFFETEGDKILAHTRQDIYQTKHRLYELEGMLPSCFLRVAKSTIVNVREIYSLQKNSLSAVSVAAFANSHKQVFVSRHYAKILREKIRSIHWM